MIKFILEFTGKIQKPNVGEYYLDDFGDIRKCYIDLHDSNYKILDLKIYQSNIQKDEELKDINYTELSSDYYRQKINENIIQSQIDNFLNNIKIETLDNDKKGK